MSFHLSNLGDDKMCVQYNVDLELSLSLLIPDTLYVGVLNVDLEDARVILGRAREGRNNRHGSRAWCLSR